MDFYLRNNFFFIYVALTILFITGCHKDNFRWETKKKNAVKFLEEKDAALVIKGISNDPQYGYSPKKPIKLGVTDLSLGVTYPEKYFNALRSPQNKKISYRRIKSCCPFKTINSHQFRYENLAVLEIYELTYEGLDKNVKVYVNFFDEPKKVLAPQGFLYQEL